MSYVDLFLASARYLSHFQEIAGLPGLAKVDPEVAIHGLAAVHMNRIEAKNHYLLAVM
jgi:hypothetical protein